MSFSFFYWDWFDLLDFAGMEYKYIFSQWRKEGLLVWVLSLFALRGKGSLRSNTNTLTGMAGKFFRDVNLQEVNLGDDIPGDVNLLIFPHYFLVFPSSFTTSSRSLCILNWDCFDLWDWVGWNSNTVAGKAVKREKFFIADFE